MLQFPNTKLWLMKDSEGLTATRENYRLGTMNVNSRYYRFEKMGRVKYAVGVSRSIVVETFGTIIN